MADSATGSKKVFTVGEVEVRVRDAPGLHGTTIRYLSPGQLLPVDPTSRTQTDGYIWWRHAAGWSAERSVDGTEVFLLEHETVATAPPAHSAVTDDSAVPLAKKLFRVGSVEVRVRSEPGLQGATVKFLPPGQSLQADPASRVEADGYVWWKHSEGWSAERSTNGKEIYLFEPSPHVSAPVVPRTTPASVDLPDGERLSLPDALFRRLPVDLDQTQWWQYYGNNVFAFELWQQGKRWYQYAQGLHAGLDFGNSSASGIKVFAGTEGIFHKRDTSTYSPNGMWVKLGDYTVIYGHLTNPRSFQIGEPIGVDTVLGEIEFGGQQHLHLEVRYKDVWILNPLLLMPTEMRDSLIMKFPPSGEYFYAGGGWTEWQTPLEQPVIRLGGPLIGPLAM